MSKPNKQRGKKNRQRLVRVVSYVILITMLLGFVGSLLSAPVSAASPKTSSSRSSGFKSGSVSSSTKSSSSSAKPSSSSSSSSTKSSSSSSSSAKPSSSSSSSSSGFKSGSVSSSSTSTKPSSSASSSGTDSTKPSSSSGTDSTKPSSSSGTSSTKPSSSSSSSSNYNNEQNTDYNKSQDRGSSNSVIIFNSGGGNNSDGGSSSNLGNTGYEGNNDYEEKEYNNKTSLIVGVIVTLVIIILLIYYISTNDNVRNIMTGNLNKITTGGKKMDGKEFIDSELRSVGKLYTDVAYAYDNIREFVDENKLTDRRYVRYLGTLKNYINTLEKSKTEIDIANKNRGLIAKIMNKDTSITIVEELKTKRKASGHKINELYNCSKCKCINCIKECEMKACRGCEDGTGCRIASCDNGKYAVWLLSKKHIQLVDNNTGEEQKHKVLGIVQDLDTDRLYIITQTQDDKWVYYYYPNISGDDYGEITDVDEFNKVVNYYQGSLVE